MLRCLVLVVESADTVGFELLFFWIAGDAAVATNSVAYDAVGNCQKTVDARGNITTNVWSPTRHLVATLYPDGQRITNIYDSRDLLVTNINALGEQITNVYDAALH